MPKKRTAETPMPALTGDTVTSEPAPTPAGPAYRAIVEAATLGELARNLAHKATEIGQAAAGLSVPVPAQASAGAFHPLIVALTEGEALPELQTAPAPPGRARDYVLVYAHPRVPAVIEARLAVWADDVLAAGRMHSSVTEAASDHEWRPDRRLYVRYLAWTASFPSAYSEAAFMADVSRYAEMRFQEVQDQFPVLLGLGEPAPAVGVVPFEPKEWLEPRPDGTLRRWQLVEEWGKTEA